MSAEIERAGVPAPQGTEPARDDVPSRFAHLRIETSAVNAEVAVPPGQTRRLLGTIRDVGVVLGAALGPALTLTAAPAGLPAWAAGGTIAGQLIVLASVALRRPARE